MTQRGAGVAEGVAFAPAPAEGVFGRPGPTVAAAGSPIAHKGMLVAAKVLALSTVDLLQNRQLLKEAISDLQERMKDRKYTTLIPKDQKARKSIR